eukprot:g7858.t1
MLSACAGRGHLNKKDEVKEPYSLQTVENLRYGEEQLKNLCQILNVPHEQNIETATLKTMALLRISDKDSPKMKRKLKHANAQELFGDYSEEDYLVQEVVNGVAKAETDDGQTLRGVSKDFD